MLAQEPDLRFLRLVARSPGLHRGVARERGLAKSTVSRRVKILREAVLVADAAGGLFLTPAGGAFLARAGHDPAGGNPAPALLLGRVG